MKMAGDAGSDHIAGDLHLPDQALPSWMAVA
jgi:hypothetical protein